jgi:hypothetical protein
MIMMLLLLLSPADNLYVDDSLPRGFKQKILVGVFLMMIST